jgi:hypothetical protein
MAELVATVEKMTDEACAAGAPADVRIAGQMAVAAVKQAHYDAIAKMEKARLDAIAQKQVRHHLCSARVLRLCSALRHGITGDVRVTSQADDLGLPSLQQIIREAEVKSAGSTGIVKMTLSPRGLQVGFPLLEPQPVKRSFSAPTWTRPVSTTDIGRSSSISRTSAVLSSTPRTPRTHSIAENFSLQPAESPRSPSRTRSPLDKSPPASPRSPSAYVSPRCVCRTPF